jgi:Transcriptional regulatory protein, C terminal
VSGERLHGFLPIGTLRVKTSCAVGFDKERNGNATQIIGHVEFSRMLRGSDSTCELRWIKYPTTPSASSNHNHGHLARLDGGKIVTREEIKAKLWPNDTVVDFDHSINVTIKTLRRALGDSADNPRYIETLARRGYRLMVATEYLESAPDRCRQRCRANAVPYREGTLRELRGDALNCHRGTRALPSVLRARILLRSRKRRDTAGEAVEPETNFRFESYSNVGL